MTNVSAVEKMAELMQQMDENSPRVAALQYSLKLVGEKIEEGEKRIAELEVICAALAAENAGLKDACGGDGSYRDCPACAHSEYIEAPETPATDAFLAEVRAQESKRVYESILDNPAVTDMESLVDWLEQNANDSVAFAAQLRKGVPS
ncbi:TPA: hypothetical protein ACRR6V_002401 [Enterobacter hormaechei]